MDKALHIVQTRIPNARTKRVPPALALFSTQQSGRCHRLRIQPCVTAEPRDVSCSERDNFRKDEHPAQVALEHGTQRGPVLTYRHVAFAARAAASEPSSSISSNMSIVAFAEFV